MGHFDGGQLVCVQTLHSDSLISNPANIDIIPV